MWKKIQVTPLMLISIPVGILWLYLIGGKPSPFVVAAFCVLSYWIMRGIWRGLRLIFGPVREIDKG